MFLCSEKILSLQMEIRVRIENKGITGITVVLVPQNNSVNN